TARSARALLVEETTRVWEMVQVGQPANAHHSGLLRIAATTRDGGGGQRCRSHVHGGGRNSGLCLEPAPALPSRRTRGHPAFFVAPQTYEMIGKILLGVEPDGVML